MKTITPKSLLLLAACGLIGWKLVAGLLGPSVTPGEVTILTDSNFHEVRREAGTLVAIYLKPG